MARWGGKKKAINRFLIVGVIVVLGFVLFCAWIKDKYVVPVVMYHKVENTEVFKTDTVSPQNFQKQMEYLKAHGYDVITMDELVEMTLNDVSGTAMPRKTVVITFDDGYVNNYTNALPVLEKYGYSAMFFVSPGLMKEEGFLNWQQVKEMREKGMVFGSHGMTQAYLPEISMDKRLFEIVTSKKILENEIKQPVEYFSYPVSGFSEGIKAEVQRAGYKGATATNRGHDRFNRDVYEINRIRFSDKDNSDMILWAKLSGYYNLFRKMKNPH